MKYTLTLPAVEITADDENAAFFQMARFFGKFADGLRGDDCDLAALNVSGAAVVLVQDAVPNVEGQPIDPGPIGE